jgi:hypothetical protein
MTPPPRRESELLLYTAPGGAVKEDRHPLPRRDPVVLAEGAGRAVLRWRAGHCEAPRVPGISMLA